MSEPAFTVDIASDVQSKKNGMRPVWRVNRRTGARRFAGIQQNSKVKASERSVTSEIRDERLRRQGAAALHSTTFPKEASLELRVRFNHDTSTVSVHVHRIGSAPARGKTGRKRDAQNQLGLICDALEEAGVCVNDNQFARIVIERVVQGEIR